MEYCERCGEDDKRKLNRVTRPCGHGTMVICKPCNRVLGIHDLPLLSCEKCLNVMEEEK